MPSIVAALGGRVLVAHNAEFDLPIIGASLSRAGAMLATPPHVCTLRLARAFCSSTDSRALGSLCEALGIEHREAHFARGDALATAELICRFISAMESVGLKCIADLDRFSRDTRAHFPFLRSFDSSTWDPVPARDPMHPTRPRSRAPRSMVEHRALRRYRDEVLGAVHDLEVTDEELARVRALRDELRISEPQARAMHGRVFHEYLGRFIDDDSIPDDEARALRELARCLQVLGWAPAVA
jgi:DNA polymerase III epsilon subunit-like protein